MSYKKGDTIHCENGHLICTLICDLKKGELGWASSMADWQQIEPILERLKYGLFCYQCREIFEFDPNSKEKSKYRLYLDQISEVVSDNPKKQEEIAEKLIRESLIKLLEEDLKDQGE